MPATSALDRLKIDVSAGFWAAGNSYLRIGLSEFHNTRFSDVIGAQPALGNLAIAVELLMKSTIAKRSLLLLWKNIPVEMKLALTVPESQIDQAAQRRFDLEARTGRYECYDFNECLALCFAIHSGMRNELGAHLKLMSSSRNSAVHSLMPRFGKHEVDRAAVASLRLFEIIKASDSRGYPTYALSEADKRFVSTFLAERVERVKRALDTAREKAKSPDAQETWTSASGWEEFSSKCPVCGSRCVLFGSTDIDAEQDEDGIYTPFLTFQAESLECNGCELKLEDFEELRLAGIDTAYDRSDEMDAWNSDHYVDYDEF